MTTLQVFQELLRRYEAVPKEQTYLYLSNRNMEYGACGALAHSSPSIVIDSRVEVNKYINRYTSPSRAYWCNTPTRVQSEGGAVYNESVLPRIEILKQIIKEIEDGNN